MSQKCFIISCCLSLSQRLYAHTHICTHIRVPPFVIVPPPPPQYYHLLFLLLQFIQNERWHKINGASLRNHSWEHANKRTTTTTRRDVCVLTIKKRGELWRGRERGERERKRDPSKKEEHKSDFFPLPLLCTVVDSTDRGNQARPTNFVYLSLSLLPLPFLRVFPPPDNE